MAAQKFYFPLDTAADVAPPAPGSDWEEVNAQISRKLVRVAGSSTLTTVDILPTACGAGDHVPDADAYHRSYVYGPLSAQTILAATTVRGQFQILENHAGNNLFLAMKLYIMSGAGAAKELLLAITRKGTEPTTSLRNTTFAATALGGSGGNVSVENGDYLVVEIGLGGDPVAASGTQNHRGSIRWGETASSGDLPVDESTATTTYRPWIEFSADIIPATVVIVAQDTETDVSQALTAVLHGGAWAAAINTGLTNVDLNSGNVRGRLRLAIKNTGDAVGGTGFKWRYSINNGTKTDITSSSSYVKTFATSFYADGDDCPQLLTADTFLTDNNGAEESTGAITLGAAIAVNTGFETELAYELVAADFSDGDSLKFYLTLSDGTVLDTYTSVPEITVDITSVIAVDLTQVAETDVSQALHLALKRVATQVTETDVSQVLTRRRSYNLTQTTSLNVAQALTHKHSKAIAQTVETNQSFAVGHSKQKPLVQAAELDLSQSFTARHSRQIAQTIETDLSQAMGRIKSKALTQTTETDVSQILNKIRGWNLTRAEEIDLTYAAVKGAITKTVVVVTSEETDEGPSITINPIHRLVNQASETDVSQPLSKSKTFILARVNEIDTAQFPVLAAKLRTIVEAGETGESRYLPSNKAKVLVRSEEIDSSVSITMPGFIRVDVDWAFETNFASVLTHAKAKNVDLIFEIDQARILKSQLSSAAALGRRRLFFDEDEGLFYRGRG